MQLYKMRLGKKRLVILFLLALVSTYTYACYSNIVGEVELISYDYPDFKKISDFQYPEYSQFDIMYIKKFNISMKTDCKNATITPRFYLETSSNSKEEFLGLETIKLENGSYRFEGTKQPGQERGPEGTISNGIQLTSNGEYGLVPFVELNYGNGTGSGTKVSEQLIYLKNGGLLNKYSFLVEDKSDKIIISSDKIWVLFGGLSVIVFILAKLSGEQLSPRKNWREWAKYSGYFILALLISLAAIGIQMSIINKQEIEVNMFSFVEMASGIFIAVYLAYLGKEFIKINMEKKQKKKIKKKQIAEQNKPEQKRVLRKKHNRKYKK